MRTFQVFDTEGKVVGSVTAESIADACRKARHGYCDFPTLVELPKDVAMSIQKVVEEKTSLEIWISGMLEEKIKKFTTQTGVPVRGIIVTIKEDSPECDVNIELNINHI